MHTIDALVDYLYLLVQADTILDIDAKQRIIANYPYALQAEKITFIASFLHAAILRPQQLIPISDARLRVDHIYGARIPTPCKHFQGREKELQQLHELLERNNGVYLWGDDGMDKSQLALSQI